jgi:hypothetical protein
MRGLELLVQTLAPAIPARKDGAGAQIKLYLQIETTIGLGARQTSNLSQPAPCHLWNADIN